jgi:Glycosyl-transferase for dystroglycan
MKVHQPVSKPQCLQSQEPKNPSACNPKNPVCLSVYLSVCLSVCLSVRLSVCLITCHVSQLFEPYVVVSRTEAPWYDERFRGYFRNKALQLHHMWRLGFTYAVHPNAFVVHFPHDSSGAMAIMMSFKLEEKVGLRVCGLGFRIFAEEVGAPLLSSR